MLRLEGQLLVVEMGNDGSKVSILDKRRGQRWLLDEETRMVSAQTPRWTQEPWAWKAVPAANSRVYPLGTGKAEYDGEGVIRASYETPAGRFVIRWIMENDRVRILVAPEDCTGVNSFALPGTFRPETGCFLSAIPNCQGILHTGKGPAFYTPKWGQETGGFSLGMFGQIAEKGALLSIVETDKDATLHWEKTDSGDIRLMWRQEPCMGQIAYAREAVLMATDADVTSLCKQYRKYEIEKGRFKTWQDKIAERPQLEYLFGSCLVFLGYWNDPNLDFEQSFRRLKAVGIDKAIVYPLYYNSTYDCTDVTGGSYMDQRRLLPLMKELGYLPGSFIYIPDGPEGTGADKWRDLKLDESGKPIEHWEMNGLTWYSLSDEGRFNWAKRFVEGDMRDLSMVHYDTLTGMPFREDYNPAHRADAGMDAEGRLRVLDFTAGKGWVISSEGFWGRAVSHYDLGNTKMTNPIGRDEYAVVPMTMLVYHDSAFHTWWEVDNYNNPEHRSQYGRGYTDRYPFIPGQPRLQSAMDALMATPPDIFPFGHMWNLIPRQEKRKLYFYDRRLEDQLVADSICCAKQVMKLNARIGKLEMTGYTLHTPDGALQESRFADGTRVIANFANVPLEAPEAGLLSPESWIALD